MGEALEEEKKKAGGGRGGGRIEEVEVDVKAGWEFCAKLRCDGLLLGREKGSDRITVDSHRQPAARLAVAEPIEESKRLNRFFKSALASLCIGLSGAVIGE